MQAKLRKRVAYSLVALSFAAIFWSFTQQLPYVIQKPGGVANVLGKQDGKYLIDLTGVKREMTYGTLDMLYVSVQGTPEHSATFFELLPALMSNDSVVLPMEYFYPLGKTKDEALAADKKDMVESQDVALKFALGRLGNMIPKDARIKFNVGGGGPSGGLMYSLGIYELLTPGTLTGGKRIAGTGTIDENGKVGPIGGIQQKMLAAYYDGDKFMLAPKENCDEVVGHVPNGLRVIPVSTFDEALDVVKVIGTDGDVTKLPVCSLE